jgi:hypothetical protein
MEADHSALMAQRLLLRWRDDPVAFAKEAMGIKAIYGRQAEMLRAVAGNDRTAVRSGHKVGKSTSAAVLASWWVGTRRKGRVVMTSSGFRQVKDILWRELRRIVREAPRGLGGKMSLDPSSGWKFRDGREVIGLSASEPEKIAGYSGEEMLFILDEASGINEEIFEALEGNRAADGTKIVMFSNPTRTSGTFYDAFNTKQKFWHRIHISSKESPNVTGEMKIPGLAGPGWLAEKLEEWGATSSIYQVRVEGNFPTQGSNAVISQHHVEMSRTKHESNVFSGPLSVGVDVARFGDDESVIRGRRGKKALPAEHLAHNRTDEVADAVIQYVRKWKGAELAKPRVKVDVIGVGGGVADYLKRHYSGEVEVVEVNVSEAATATEGIDKHGERKPTFSKLRDQLWFAIGDWLKEGGTYEADDKLDQELVAPTYGFDAQGRRKVSSKDEMRKIIGRSPDRADALGLCVYEPPAPARVVVLFS